MTGVRVGRVPKRRRGHRVKRQSAYTCGEDWIDTNNDTLIQEFEVHESRDDHIILKHQGYTAEDLWNEMDRNSSEVPREFLETGRTGRRNAMPDILHPQGAEVTTADLPSRLQQLVTTDPDNSQPSSSKTDLEQSNSDVTEKKDSCS